MIGTLAFLLGLLGYSLALALTIALLLKPFVPGVGMWAGQGHLNVGANSNMAGTHEVLGQWFVPVIALIAFAAAIGTTSALRLLMRKRPRNPAYQVSQTPV